MRLILLSGMAADERLFGPQIGCVPDLVVLPWIAPYSNESVRAYSVRLARTVEPVGPCVVGGASFGGVVALEMATHLPAVACVLIGSIRSPAELPWRWKIGMPLAFLGPDRLRTVAALAATAGERFLARGTIRRLRKLAKPDAAFVRWAMCAVLRWRPSPATRRIPVSHIHGELDRTLPVDLTRPDVVVPGGGHALTLTSSAAVNEYLAAVMARCDPSPGSRPVEHA